MIHPQCEQCSSQAGGAFASLDARHRPRLLAARVPHAYQPGQHLYFQGNPALAVYCIHQGLVKLSRLVPGGDEHVIGTRSAGDVIGYRAVLTGRHYHVSAEPLENTLACAIPREAFLELLRENPEVAYALLVRLSRDSLATEKQILTRALERVRTRLARFLLQGIPAASAGARGSPVITLQLSREEIAHLIDTTPATLSRTLHALAERGVLEPDRHQIRVLDPAALERMARLDPSSDSHPPVGW
jgi:CRP/FNR family transcriptional regulator, polysaccharide utilization system transcription regulator